MCENSKFPRLPAELGRNKKMNVITVETKKGEKFLRRAARQFDFARHTAEEIRELIRAMREAMRRADGIGLSANQIGLESAVFVARVENKLYTVFNPRITKISSETEKMHEGCLSVPEKFGAVRRPARVTLEGQDPRGKPLKIKAWGLLARVFQHETDHLNGILFIDKAEKVEGISQEPPAA